MRIVQIIDSLEVGGAERMAVNYANALTEKIDFSGLIATRKQGNLKSQLRQDDAYLFLDRKTTIDLKAVFKLKTYCKKNEVDYVHAHGTSYFIAFLLKLVYPKIKVIWHDHYGLSEFLDKRASFFLKIASAFFEGIIVVNYQLEQWVVKELNCKRVIYLPNFTNYGVQTTSLTTLKGNDFKRILCLANLRPQKDHFLLLEVAEKLKNVHPDWSFHLVGKDFEDDYSKQIRTLIIKKELEKTVFVYGAKNDTGAIISQSDIAILTSNSEGLPVALLEYGLFKKPVVVTDVGEIPFIIKNGVNGSLVASENPTLFYEALLALIQNPELRSLYGEALHTTVIENNSETAVIGHYLNWIKESYVRN